MDCTQKAFYVAFLDDDGKLYIKNKVMDYNEACRYASGIAESRQPIVLHHVNRVHVIGAEKVEL